MKHVLVIDDDRAIHLAVSYALKGLPFEVVQALNGTEGLQSAQADPPGLIYLDLNMPGMNGVETLRRLRAQGCVSPLYILTAFSALFETELKQARDDGLDFEIMQKPAERDTIREVTQGALGPPGKTRE